MRRVVLILLLVGALLLVAWPALVPSSIPDDVPEPRGEAAPDIAPEPGGEPTDPVPAPPARPHSAPDIPAVEPDTTAHDVTLLVQGPDGKPVPRAEARVWAWGTEDNRKYVHRRYVEIREGQGHHVLDREGLTRLRIEVYGAEGCGALLTEPIDPVAQVVEVRLPEPLAISGVVVDEEGVPLAGVRIEARTAYPEFRTVLAHIGRPHGAAVSGEDGTFRIDGLGAREYFLRMTPTAGLVPLDSDERVPGGADSRKLVCRRLVTLAFQVLGPDGQPVAGAEVCIRALGTGHCERTDARGRVRFENCDPERVDRIDVRPPDDREDLLETTVRDPEQTTIRLGYALPLAGVVRDADGRVVPEAEITWRAAGSDGPWRYAHANTDGEFRIRRVPDGPIEIRAAAPDYEEEATDHHVQVVKAGRENLVFAVKSTPSIVLRFEDWAEGESGHASLHIEGEEPYRRRAMDVGKGGMLRYAGLRADDVASVFVRTDRGRMWLGHGLRPRAEVRVVRGLVPSRITGRLVGMPEGARLAVCAHVLWNLDIPGRLEPDGRFEIGGVPPGSWRIEAYPTHAGWDYRGEVEASAGAHVEIRR